MKRQLILWILMTAGFSIAAQSLLTTSGAYHQNVQGSIDWSLGEVFINQFDNSQGAVLQGFQQGNQLTVVINATDTAICPGENVILEANSLGGGPNHFYSWSTNPGGFLAPSKIVSVQPTTSTWYIVEVNDGGISPNVKDSIFIKVNPNNFNISFSASPTSFTSPPFNTTISNTTANSSHYKWNWSFGDGNVANIVSPSHTYNYDGTYTISVIATDSITGCYDTLVKPNYISCTGGGTNPCTLVAEISPTGTAVICAGDSIKLSATYNSNATYSWILNGIILPNANDSVLWAKSTGMYQVMLTDTVCSVFSAYFNLAQYPVILPVVTSNGSITPCTNDSMELISSSGFTNYIWNTAETTNSIWVKNSGYYSVSAEDIFGCRHSSIPFVVNASLLPIPEICIVGVDSATNNNWIIWQRQANPLIDSFKVYRETFVANQYQLIGAKAFSDQSMFIDVNSNPAQQAYRYKITAIDTCGAETPMSDFHKTNHLTINAGLNNTWNLIWDGYQGFSFGSYRIYRGADSLNLQFLTQIQSTLTSFTDLNPPTGNVYYQIEVVSPNDCYPDSVLNKAVTNYNTSRSNVANTSAAPNIGFETANSDGLSFRLYPNPNKGEFIIEVIGSQDENFEVSILNGIGSLIKVENLKLNQNFSMNFDISYLPKGLYFISLVNENTSIICKVIIQ